MHVRLLDLDVIEAGGKIARDVAGFCAFADNLRVYGDIRRHVDDEVALHFRAARKAAVVGQAAQAPVACLGVGESREVIGAGRYAVLCENAFGHLHLAASAYAAPAANALDIDAEGAGGVEHRRAERKASAPAGRHEENQGVGAAC